MRFDYPTRVKTGIVLLLLLALYGSSTPFRQVTQLRANRRAEGRDPAVDWIAEYEQRFETIKRDLPPDAVVGYVTDQPPDPAMDLRLAQYALAPVIVSRTGQTELVVGNFHDPAQMPGIVRQKGLVLVKDYGQGVALLRGKAK